MIETSRFNEGATLNLPACGDCKGAGRGGLAEGPRRVPVERSARLDLRARGGVNTVRRMASRSMFNRIRVHAARGR